jgi:hypothetical protein
LRGLRGDDKQVSLFKFRRASRGDDFGLRRGGEDGGEGNDSGEDGPFRV